MEIKFEIQSSEGRNISARKWIDESKEEYKGVIQIVHGMQEHIGRYSDFANFLVKHGYIVIGHDHLGHGNTAKTEEELGHFSNQNGWDYLVEDIHRIQNQMQQEYLGLPYIILGHSMGSLLVRTYVAKYQDNISGIIISGTSGQIKDLTSGIALIKIMEFFLGKQYRSKLIEYLVVGSFNRKFKPTKTKADWTTSDENEVTKFVQDEKCGKNFTLQAYLDLLQGTKWLAKQENINNTLHVPILIFSGSLDPVGEQETGVKRVYEMLRKTGNKNVTLKFFENGRHEMLNEKNRQEVYEFVLNWIKENIK